jgi:hypothetical protein
MEGHVHDKRFKGDFDTEIETILLAELTKIINRHVGWIEDTEERFSLFF